jgi:hypothetical protein
MQINIFNVIVVLGFIAGKQLTKNPHTHTHTHKTCSRTQKAKTENRNYKVCICVWPDPIVPLSEYCFDVVTIFPKYKKKKPRACQIKENIIS